MTASDKFIAKYGASDLPYATEIVAALRDGSARVSHVPDDTSPGSATELLHTYEIRLKHLAGFATPHAMQLHRDVEAFCSRLQQKKSERCVAWGIEREPHFIYWLWEWSSDGSFVGATKMVDDRKISDAERITLWGERKDA
jgi:hypothetical protein